MGASISTSSIVFILVHERYRLSGSMYECRSTTDYEFCSWWIRSVTVPRWQSLQMYCLSVHVHINMENCLLFSIKRRMDQGTVGYYWTLCLGICGRCWIRCLSLGTCDCYFRLCLYLGTGSCYPLLLHSVFALRCQCRPCQFLCTSGSNCIPCQSHGTGSC